MPADQPHFSIPQAAVQLGVSDNSVRRWIKSGRLEAITLPSGRHRIYPEAIAKILTPARLAS